MNFTISHSTSHGKWETTYSLTGNDWLQTLAARCERFLSVGINQFDVRLVIACARR